MLITETKMDQSFPDSQFITDGYLRPFRRDRNQQRGGILFFYREDIPCHSLNMQLDIEHFFLK